MIKNIRQALDLSQAGFGEELHVSDELVNRWENGRVIPEDKIQSGIFELCQKHGLSVYEMLLARIQKMTEEIKQKCTSSEVVLYHGSKSGINGKIALKSNTKCDFGKGFYMGSDPTQALTRVSGYRMSKFYILTLDLKDLRCLDLPADPDWALLIAYNRNLMKNHAGTHLYNKYRDMMSNKDIIIGKIADNGYSTLIDSFLNDEIRTVTLLNRMPYLELGTQYAAVSEKACQAIRKRKTIPLFNLMKLAIKEYSKESTKSEGSNTTISSEEEDKGLLFSELLKEAGD